MSTRNLSLALVAIILMSGCSAMKSRLGNNSSTLPAVSRGSDSKSAASSRSDSELPSYGKPEKMLAVWKDSVRSQDGRPPMRGFGGRLYLYDDKGAPIRAQGDLVVYGFDDSVTDREGSKADQKIVLGNQQFQKSYSESALGPSYNVWIDWDEVGGPDKSVTLIPFFRTRDGDVVRAGQAIYTLHTPGRKKDVFKERLASHDEGLFSNRNKVKHADYIQRPGDKNQIGLAGGQIETSERPESGKRVRTTTIFVPQDTQKRLQSSSFGVHFHEPRQTDSRRGNCSRQSAGQDKARGPVAP